MSKTKRKQHRGKTQPARPLDLRQWTPDHLNTLLALRPFPTSATLTARVRAVLARALSHGESRTIPDAEVERAWRVLQQSPEGRSLLPLMFPMMEAGWMTARWTPTGDDIEFRMIESAPERA